MNYQHLLHWEVSAMLEIGKSFNWEKISAVHKISATLVNISGRQRMLSQRTAFLALRLVYSKDLAEREQLCTELWEAILLFEKSHQALIQGDPSMNLSGQLSGSIQDLYWKPPLNLDKQVRSYIADLRAFIQEPDIKMTLDNPFLMRILKTSDRLLKDLDIVVTQYQDESEAEQLEIAAKLLALYEQSCIATAKAEEQATELENAMNELKKMQAKLLHSEKMSSLGQLVASVAHEINNPVSFIYGNLNHAEVYTQDLLGLLELYRETYPDANAEIQNQIEEMELDFLVEDLPKVLCSMQVGADRIRQIVSSLRNFSRTDDREMKFVDLHEGIDTTLLILHNRLKAQPNHPAIEIVKNYGKLPLVECYPGQMNQVFMNILSNAIEALEEVMNNRPETHGDFLPQIHIRTETQHPDRVSVRIADNGPGMTPLVKAQVFEEFFTTKDVGKGTGLGLSISHQILVENHRGSLHCESTVGQGTEFWIEIPVQQHQNSNAIA